MNNSQKLDLILEKVNKIDGIDKRLEIVEQRLDKIELKT